MRCLLGLCLALAADALHPVRTPADVSEPGPAFTAERWALVDFAPVPPFLIDTHDPVTQDVYISGAAHAGVAPWDPFIWDRIVALSRGVPKGSLFVDVGANLGYFSLMAASLGYTVASFEPMSRNARKLSRSVARNGFAGRVSLYQNAVGTGDGRLVSLRETDALNQGNGRVTGEPVRAPSGVFGVDYVDTVSLSSVLLFAASQSTGAHIVKVDVEGLEPDVLRGARQWICARSVRHVLIEFSEATRASPASGAVDMFAFMQRAGYAVSDVSVESDAPLESANGACSEPY
jgi:FkbM family methyltransferase